MTPAIYLLAHLSVLVLSGLVITTLEQHGAQHSWLAQGDVDAAVLYLVLGSVALPLVSLLLVRLDGSRRPGVADHVRHSAGVYALVVLAGLTAVTQPEQRYSLGFGVIVGAGLLGLYAAALDVLVVWLARRRPDAV